VLCFSFRFFISGIVFCKRGGDFPLFTKTMLFLSLAILSPGKLIFIRLSVLLFVFTARFYPFIFFFSSPSLLPAIGKKILMQKVLFFLF